MSKFDCCSVLIQKPFILFFHCEILGCHEVDFLAKVGGICHWCQLYVCRFHLAQALLEVEGMKVCTECALAYKEQGQ